MSNECDLLSGTLPEFIYKCAGNDRIAAVFDHEKITFTFSDVKKEVSLSFFFEYRIQNFISFHFFFAF